MLFMYRCLCLCFLVPACALLVQHSANAQEIAPQLVVLEKAPASAQAQSAIGKVTAAHANHRDSSAIIEIGALRVLPAHMTIAESQSLARMHGVKYIAPEMAVTAYGEASMAPVKRTSVAESALSLYNITAYPDHDGTGITIYLLDTGVDVYHTDLHGRANWAFNAVNNADYDESGHGTAVAGLLVGERFGFAKGARIISAKVLDAHGTGTVEWLLRGLEFVYKAHISSGEKRAIINLSLGASENPLLNDAVTEVTKAGIVVVAAAGNGDQHGRGLDACGFSPANAPDAITVGATDVQARFAEFSNYGTCVHVLAPGSHIHSISRNNNTKMMRSGTSFSAPVVSGLIARILAQDPTTTTEPNQIRQRVRDVAAKGVVHGELRGTPNELIYSQVQRILWAPWAICLAILSIPAVLSSHANDAHLIILKDRPSASALKSLHGQLLKADDASVHASGADQTIPDAQVISIGDLHIIPAKLEKSKVKDWEQRQDVHSVETDIPVRVFQGALQTQSNPPTWALERIDQRNLPLDNQYTYPVSAGEGVTVYVIDTGIALSNPQFGGRATWGTTTIDGAPNADDNGHGTFVAGLIGSSGYGVAKRVNMVAVKSLDMNGEGYLSDVLRGMEWTLNNYRGRSDKRAIVNMSLGLVRSRVMNLAVAELNRAGLLIVAAAGNGDALGRAENACDYSPASADEALTVGATDRNDTVPAWSNYGNCVSILAPGNEIRSLDYMAPDGSYVDSGTSFSAPLVTGVGALALGLSNQAVDPGQLKSFLLSISTRDVIQGNLRGTPNQLLYNRVDVIRLSSQGTSGHRTSVVRLSVAALVVALTVWAFIV
ncbi:peptidase S8/S53 domain-containing protein [Thamnocephalis sphaerospora]|uniref:Peptidase S8/S53 domain-containing protein n=1 Tax=Thamnocephalis sphaerospora TaxID=78915 RepID=A0A4P9XRH3_9FUNG|nr:peptidase S8/S53 domain-containing protein [Thamnocephalis sphaerospora]|eukprot:RKP08111.1 peptidase S8/S53 domain-containing protein [Thamnocephalis sphaerospora]